MSGIVGSYFNTRGSGVVAKLGTDGQLFTSSGAGVSQAFEAAAGGGKIGQVVQTAKTDQTSLGSTSPETTTFTDITGMSVAITPTAASSKILILTSLNLSTKGVEYDSGVKMQRDIESAGYADVAVGDAYGSRSRALFSTLNKGHDREIFNRTMTWLDSPSYTLTDVITYKIQWSAMEHNHTIYLNRSGDATDSAKYFSVPSTITVMEVLA